MACTGSCWQAAQPPLNAQQLWLDSWASRRTAQPPLRARRIAAQARRSCSPQANKAGADEALMLDPHGFVATCNSTNFFVVRKGEVGQRGPRLLPPKLREEWTLPSLPPAGHLLCCRQGGLAAGHRSAGTSSTLRPPSPLRLLRRRRRFGPHSPSTRWRASHGKT